MDRKMPKVFANKIEKDVSNNDRVYYSFKNTNEMHSEIKKEESFVRGTNIMQKLKSIFSSPVFVYKAKVDIVTDDGKMTKEIVGYNNTHVMTMNDELIPISRIKDIYFTK